MTAPETSHWIKANVTLKHKETLATKTLSFVNRAEIEDVTSDSWPLLVDISNLGVASDRVSILPQSGSIRLIDSIGSFGVDRKFSDLLERYEIRNQTIEILYDQTTTDNNDPSSYTTIFKGKVLNWSIVSDQLVPNITIFFNSQILSKRYINKKISPVDFPNAPTESYFKSVPVVLGEDVQVRPLMITAKGSTTPEYVYATTLAAEHGVGGVQTYYARNNLGEYVTVRSASNVNTEVISLTTNTSAVTISTREACYAFKLVSENTYNYIFSHIDVLFHSSSMLPQVYDGIITLRIYEAGSIIIGGVTYTGPVGSSIVEASRDASDYDTEFESGSSFYIEFSLNRPFVVASDKKYFISLTHSPDAGTNISARIDTGASAETTFQKLNGTQNWIAGSSSHRLTFKAYAIKLTDTATGSNIDSNGLGVAKVALTQHTGTETLAIDLSKLELVFSIDGLKDDSGGNITGSANSVITRLHHAVELLEQEYNGSSWSASGNWDFDIYSDTHTAATSGKFARTISGSTSGDVTFERWLADACKSLAARPVMRKNGKLAIYYWGTEQASIKTLTQENSKVTRVDALDPSYALTVLKLAYNKSILTFKPENLATEDISRDFQAVIEWYFSANALASSIIGSAAGLYGERHNADLYYTWIDSTRSAEALAFYLLSTYNHPPIYVEVTAPLSEMTSAEPMNVIELKHPALPNFDGASSNAKLPDYEGTPVDVTDGYVLTRAKRYRSQIEGMFINFSNDLIPSLVMTTRLLINDKDPT